MTLFVTQNLAEISSPDYPGERLIACHKGNSARPSDSAGPSWAGHQRAARQPGRRLGKPGHTGDWRGVCSSASTRMPLPYTC
jgi:hypothetical protein